MEAARTRKARGQVVKVKTPSTSVTGGGIWGKGGQMASGREACRAGVPVAEHAGTRALVVLAANLCIKRIPRGWQGEERGAAVG